MRLSYVFVCLVFVFKGVAFAQRPQDNWYLEQTWTKTMAATNGGLSAPYGIAIGPDQRIYIGDQSLGRIQVYLPDGTFSFAITNTFGGGESFSQPRGMITDQEGNLYVADYARNAVFVFSKDGVFVRKIGGVTGGGDGQMSGVFDVGVSLTGNVFILEQGNNRVSVFDSSGNFIKTWGGYGVLDGQLSSPRSMAVSPVGEVFICQAEQIKVFDLEGTFLRQFSCYGFRHYGTDQDIRLWPVSIRVDPSGLLCVIREWYQLSKHISTPSCFNPEWAEYNSDGALIEMQTLINAPLGPISGYPYKNTWPCHAVSPNGKHYIVLYDTKQLTVIARTFREQVVNPPNSIPLPNVIRVKQRSNSPLVDIDYLVTDADDVTVQTGMLIFTNATQTLANCLPQPKWVEGTETNLGASIAANVKHRVTWNAASDWSTSLGNFRVAVVAKDSRQGLLDIHYLRLPSDRGMPGLKISRSPLIANDFMQVWWWLLAVNDPTVRLTGGNVYAVGGTYDAQLLCDTAGTTTAAGRAFVYEKMAVRLATTQEVSWAAQGSLSGATNQWDAARTVGGRPPKVNEYGFDTGNWGANAWWVVPLE